MKAANTSGQTIVPEISRRTKSLDRLPLEAAIDQCSSAMLLTTTDGVICYVNKRFTALTGYTAEELIGQRPSILQSGRTSREFYDSMWETILSGREWRGEIENRRKNGELYWESLSVSPVYDESGRLQFFMALAEDISARKRLEQSLHDSLAELSRLNQSLNQFTAMVSHDLQGPLGNVIGGLEFLSDRYLTKFDEDERAIFNAVESSAKHASTLIRELLTYSRSELKNWQPSAFDVNKLLEKVCESLYIEIESSGAEIHWENLPTISGNATLIRELFYNLIANAIKYRGERKPQVEITARSSGNMWIFSIADNGMGIPAEDLTRIFEPLVRAGNVKNIPGTGLGLALCRRIAELHDGEASVESVLGKGTTFYVSLPR